MLIGLLPIGKLGGADSQSPDHVQHGLRSHHFVQLDQNETNAQAQKLGADLSLYAKLTMLRHI